ncbi:MAG: GTP-binding protein [Candidatus Kariarchaeaceae archaeon]|jgi:elongation factor 1-alpha
MKFLGKESDIGNIEYKLTLSDKMRDNARLEELASQMRFRLYEGGGEALYYIGVTDDGIPKGISKDELKDSIISIEKIADIAGAKLKVLRREMGNDGEIAEVLIRREKNPNELPVDIRIASVGNVDAGKSTLIGVLLKGKLDDGRGAARTLVFRYLHELESGRTSSVSTTVLGFDVDGNIVNQDKVHTPTDLELLERSIKTITFNDLAGHERYLKTTIFGLTGLLQNYAMLVVASNQGILQMTKEHLGLVISLKIPVFVIVTKIDMTPDRKKKETLTDLKKILKIPGISRVPLIVKNNSDAVVAAININKNSVIPVFEISAVTGQGISNLTQFLELLPSRTKTEEIESSKEFRAYIDDIFSVSGVGTVVAAIVYGGSLIPQQTVQLGPFDDGSFREVRVKSIEYKRVSASQVVSGQSATFALHGVGRDQVRKGMVLLDSELSGAFHEFEAEIYVLYHSTTIRPGYSPVIHCRSIKQSAKMISFETEVLRTGDRANVRFRFLYRPEHIRAGQRIVFREGRTKGIGIITKLFSE